MELLRTLMDTPVSKWKSAWAGEQIRAEAARTLLTLGISPRAPAPGAIARGPDICSTTVHPGSSLPGVHADNVLLPMLRVNNALNGNCEFFAERDTQSHERNYASTQDST